LTILSHRGLKNCTAVAITLLKFNTLSRWVLCHKTCHTDGWCSVTCQFSAD